MLQSNLLLTILQDSHFVTIPHMRVETPALALDPSVADLTVVVLDNFARVDTIDAHIRVSVHVMLVLNKK